MLVLALDSGSSSLKYALLEMPQERSLEQGTLASHGAQAQQAAVDDLIVGLLKKGMSADAIGHRVVFGGSAHTKPERVDERLLQSLEHLCAFDPVHMPPAIATIRAAQKCLPDAPAVACFDSAFHHAMPEIAHRYPLPKHLDPAMRRYGYHGLSYEYVVATLPLRGRSVIAHLGNGASMAATLDGRPMDTTMGLTPLGGMTMGTRPGDLDPGVLLYLLATGGMSTPVLAEMLYEKSGLLGVSGSTADMRELLKRAPNDRDAKDAIDLFVYNAAKQLGGLASVLGGLDTLVFTGGIGEHAWQIREAIGNRSAHLGVRIDTDRNRCHADVISVPGSDVEVRVIVTNENLMIARHVVSALS